MNNIANRPHKPWIPASRSPGIRQILLSITFAAFGCSLAIAANDPAPVLTKLERTTPDWLTNAVCYQIYPQSFYDSTGDGTGDLPGITAKLDYIKSLGVDAIWLNPFYDSPYGDAGYDVRDYKKVGARYGTNEDARRLFAEAHRRGIRVIIDLVAGHTSVEHPWFQESLHKDASTDKGFFVWAPQDSKEPDFIQSPGPRVGKYLKNYYPFQPALNYGYGRPDPNHPWEHRPSAPDCMAVREAMRDVMKYWLDLGCDGFRVDMASSLIKKDDGKELNALWQDYRTWLKRYKPDAVLVSEWCRPSSAIPAGFDIDFMLHFNNTAYTLLMNPIVQSERPNHSFFSIDGSGDITAFLAQYLPEYEKTRKLGFISMPTSNHDFSRPRYQGREIPDLKVIYTMLLTMPGIPFIYYGDEIGMRNLKGWPKKEGADWRGSCRSPMQWDAGTNAGFSTTSSADNLYLPLDPDPARPNLADQEKDKDSLLNFSRQLIALRHQNPSLSALGGFKPLYAQKNAYPFVYLRSGGPKDFIVALNPSHAAVECEGAELEGATLVLGSGAEVTGKKLKMGPASYAIYSTKGSF